MPRKELVPEINFAFMKLQITCQQATKMISMKEERKLSFKNNIKLMMHLFICTACKLFYKQNKLLKKTFTRLHKHSNASLTAEEKQQIITSLEEN